LFTGSSAILGLLLAVVIGISLGIVFAELYYVRNGLFPIVVFLYSTPAAILAPIFIIWFGSGVPAVIAFAAWTAFFPIFINTVTGLNATKEEFEQLGSLFNASRIQMIRHIKFWYAIPNIVSGIKVAVTLSMVGAIIAEYIATGSGLGGQIISGLFRFEEGWVFGVVITIGVFSIVLYKLTCSILDRLTPQNVD
jgi:NitT/TauT family transport system permease protein